MERREEARLRSLSVLVNARRSAVQRHIKILSIQRGQSWDWELMEKIVSSNDDQHWLWFPDVWTSCLNTGENATPWDLSHPLSLVLERARVHSPVPPAPICGGAPMEFPLRSFSHDVMTPIFLTHSKQCVGADAPDTQVAGSSWNWVGCANRWPRCTHRDKGESRLVHHLIIWVFQIVQ